ncbi:MAG TPA: endonuclease/exonuclease/phosphatase family protein [Flavihumibacter sp.]|jgi:endonuclease/exonuclease/phosphatase family metal-dependent hydrolase
MPITLRKISKKIAILLTIGVCLVYALACIAWYVPPGKYWYIAILGVGYAFLLMTLILSLLFWILVRSKWLILPLVTLLLSWQSIHAFFAFKPMAPSTVTKPEGAYRIMQWNVERFGQMRYDKRSRAKRKAIFSYLKIQDPDILCLQEFLESNDPTRFAENIPYLRDSLGYRYYYYAMDHRRPDTAYEHGVAIFSKFPIKKTFRGRFDGPKEQKANESYIWADIDLNGQTVRVMTTHLQSLLFTAEEFETLEAIRKGDDNSLARSKNIFRKFKNAYEFRQSQAEKIRAELDKSPHPTIITGDFNDLPHSFVYHTVKGPYRDAFTEKGFGVGRTYSAISPTLRIDYVLVDRSFELVQCRNPHPNLSDHYPVITDFRIKASAGAKSGATE